MKEMKLDKDEICQYQKNRDPYLMIDYATKIIPGVSAEGYKDLKDDEWFFKVHWKNDPNMPGMLQIESLVQMSALSILTLDGNKGKTMYLVNANNLRFFKKILPRDRLYIKTTVDSYKRGIAKCHGEGHVEDKIVCKADFTLVLKDKIIKIRN
jgi:3-hydroxyacyl-[acyl-carrier-protein] dehydratase|tara:strand:- start:162 stop:620 length:459 start_codon:yes stop_codon:yes gene_type:complete